MLLAINMGNTHIEWGLFEGERLAAHWRMSTDVRRTADEYAATLWDLLQRAGIRDGAIQGVILSSVVPPLQETIETVCAEIVGRRPLLLGHTTETGIRLGVDYPAELGADRIANAVAAYTMFRVPLIVVDFGTATNFDVVDGEGVYLGGAIAPGMGISAEALFERTAKLPRVAIESPPHAIGSNTVHNMQSGLIFGYVGLVEELVSRIRGELEMRSPGSAVRVIATGGLAGAIARYTRVIEAIHPDLALQGLRIVWERNQSSSPSTDRGAPSGGEGAPV